MRGIDRYGGDIDAIDDVSNYTECNKLCHERKDCFIWTYVEGSCYVKSENTFRTRHPNVIGGIKDCGSEKQEGKSPPILKSKYITHCISFISICNFLHGYFQIVFQSALIIMAVISNVHQLPRTLSVIIFALMKPNADAGVSL